VLIRQAEIIEMNGQNTALFAETLSLAFADQGQGRPYLILHGGAGPATVASLAGALAKTARAIVPTHPGFAGEPRPDWFARIDDLALAYLALIERLDLSDVVVIGNSVGGWIASEIALRKSPRVAGIVLLNAVGIDTGSPDKTIVDPTKLQPAERSALAFHNPAKFAIVPAGAEGLAALLKNQETLRVYAARDAYMYDPNLRARLAGVTVPALVAWGESDKIVDAQYGRRFADSIPGARFELVPEAGHFPQIEQLDKTIGLIGAFAGGL
jgi:pimeloyl-ACP methyl ester carboxylesterase